MKHWSDETRWQPLADVVARIKARAEAVHRAGADDAAEAALDEHDDPVAAEHRQRMAERRRRDA
jgi:hypothetical protein